MHKQKIPSILYSIGHSNHSIERFLELIERHGIQAIADVRSSPYSQYTPHFNRESLEISLKERGVAYVFLGAELGARRHEPECYVDGKVDYERIPATEAFRQGVKRLLAGASRMKVAMLCAEKDPLTCHRTILIGRHVKELLADVRHILPDGRIESQSEAEQRLLIECNLNERNFFLSREERLLEAFQQRAIHIAYEEPVPNA